MEKPIIGILGRENLLSLDGRTVQSIDDTYRRAVIKFGGIPITILPTQGYEYQHEEDRALNEEEADDLIRILKMCDGIIITGGCKIYEYDKFIAKYALDNDIPIMGTCLGMQLLASVDCDGERVIEKISNGVDHYIKEDFVHKVKISKDSKLYSIIQSEEFMTNSRHRCNIIKTNHFDIVGYSEDGIIEAIELKNKKFAIGVQWHPEMLIEKSEESSKFFKEFIRACM